MSTLDYLRAMAHNWGLVEAVVPDDGEILFHNPHEYMANLFTCKIGIEPDLHTVYLWDPGYYTAIYDIALTADKIRQGAAVTDIDTVISIWSTFADQLRSHGLPVARTAEMVGLHRRARYSAFSNGTREWSLTDCCRLLEVHLSWDAMHEFLLREIPITYATELLSGEVTWVLLRELFPVKEKVKR